MLIVLLNAVVPTWQLGSAGVATLQVAIMCLAQFLVILVRLKRFSGLGLCAQGFAVLLTNLSVTVIMLSALQGAV